MNKNKIIATAVILFLFLVPFHWGYLTLENEGGIVSALCMGFIIITAVIAIMVFNKNTGESHH
jgi:hypothetical protein